MLTMEWVGHTSEDRRATVLLRQEQELLLELFRRQHEPALAPGQSRDGLQAEIVALVEMIGRVERDVFFPALPGEYKALVHAFVADNATLSHCAASVRRNTASIARHNAQGERLELLAREHVAAEQSLLFPAVERDHPELNRVLYDRLVDARRHLSSAASC